jgi:S-adenosylmethionine:tRNA ribosyltransferase-isomerase
LWTKFYAAARPIQYSYLKHGLELWDQQTIFSGVPAAIEPPSASFVFSWDLLFQLRAAGVDVAPLTHGTGISNTGDPAIDAQLPFPERFRIPHATQRAVWRARNRGGRVIAVGTGVVRALESWGGGADSAGWRWTDLKLRADSPLKVVDGVLTGMHEPGASHIDLLQAFISKERLQDAYTRASERGFLWHEYGDVCLIFRS